MKMKVSELDGGLLDLWVAKADGKEAVFFDGAGYLTLKLDEKTIDGREYSPSTDWALGGPIIEREGFGICKFYEPTDGPIPEGGEWCALWRDDSMRADGPTPLIAGMGLFVMSRFGEEVTEE